jgi:hypothetical protein
VDAFPLFFLFSLLFSIHCFTLCRCTFSRIFLLVVFLVSFLILSHDFHEALFLTTRTYLSRVQYIQNVLKYGMEKQSSRNLYSLVHFPPFSSHRAFSKYIVLYPSSIASLSTSLALTLVLVLM